MTKALRFTLSLFLMLGLAHLASAQCNASFTTSISGATVHFSSAAGPVNSFHWWSFGDGDAGATNAPTHTYSQPGTYTVVHFMRDSLNTCADSVLQQVTVSFTPTCTAAFTYTFDSVTRIYTFTSQSTATTATDSIGYTWTVDGVLRSTAATFTITLTPGAHSVYLQIVTRSGCTHTVSQTINTPSLPPPTPCNLHASYTYTQSATNLHTFTFSGSPSGPGYQYLWLFGDGYSATTAQATHTYVNSNYYPVTFRVIQSGTTCRDSVRAYVNVPLYGPDSCTGTIGHMRDSTQNDPNKQVFWVNSTYGTVSQLWSFTNLNPPHDSVFVSASNPSHTFPGPGTYQVCVYVQFTSGCRNYICDTVQIGNGGRVAADGTVPSYPNPAVNRVQLRVPLTQAGAVTITIYNAFGTAVYTEQRTGRAGSNDFSLPVQQLSRGQYYIDIKYNGGQVKSRFQKL